MPNDVKCAAPDDSRDGALTSGVGGAGAGAATFLDFVAAALGAAVSGRWRLGSG